MKCAQILLWLATTLLAGCLNLKHEPVIPGRDASAFQRMPDIFEGPIDAAALAQGVGQAGRLRLTRPIAIAANRTALFVADSGAGRVLRYDLFRKTWSVIGDVRVGLTERSIFLAAQPDQSLLVVETASRRVTLVAPNGRTALVLPEESELGQPVGVAQDAQGNFHVLDALHGQIVTFNSIGRPLRATRLALTSPYSIAAGGEAVYVLDRARRTVLDLSAAPPVAVLTDRDLSDPVAMAADAAGRLFVADRRDRSIKLFARSGLVAQTRGGFQDVGSIAFADNYLYAADADRGRVHVYLVDPNLGR